MIIFRYLAREVLLSMFAVSGILLLIIVSGRFVKYLAEAASGKLAANALLAIIAYRLPGFLELILPLGLFIGFLLSYGRMYMDSEMTVLNACGFSLSRLLLFSFFPAIVVALLVAGLTLVVSPYGIARSDNILMLQKNRNQFDHLTPAQFQYSSSGDSITYAETLSDDRKQLRGVFMAEMREAVNGDKEIPKLVIINAERGEQVVDPNNGLRYLKLYNGARYLGNPGERNYEVVEFEVYWQYLPSDVNPFSKHSKISADSLPTRALFDSDKPDHVAALHWRMSLPVLVVVITLLAVPLSKTNPRQGRYVQMIPAILLYIVYLVCLNAARGAVEEGDSGPLATIWTVHAVFLGIALLLLSWPPLRRWHRSRQARKQGGIASA